MASIHQTPWPDLIPEDQWQIYKRVIGDAKQREIPFALGGAFCRAHYTGLWRNTKDIDLYVLPKHKDAMIETVTAAGLQDYYDTLPYDRSWIYRSHCGEIIVDIIWAMANGRGQVDEEWIFNGPETNLRGELLRVIPAEEIIWDKLYIMQRDRCDWPDALNLIYATGAVLDWHHIFERLGDDEPLLAGLLSVFGWLCSAGGQIVPRWVWSRLNLPAPLIAGSVDIDQRRVQMLDSRPWFTAAANS